MIVLIKDSDGNIIEFDTSKVRKPDLELTNELAQAVHEQSEALDQLIRGMEKYRRWLQKQAGLIK